VDAAFQTARQAAGHARQRVFEMSDAPIDPPPAFTGWEDYRRFAESVKSKFRYVRGATEDDFLREVLATSGNRRLTIPQGNPFWRARLGCEQEVLTSQTGELIVTWREDRPYTPAAMKPVANWQSEGRANPRGIPYLYLAMRRETALAEVRPWIGAKVSVAQFKIRRDLTVIECTRHDEEILAGLLQDKGRPRQDGLWAAIDQAFATPVNRDDEPKEYIPTQIIAELFKAAGVDGVAYKSLLTKPGFNLALFNLDDADLVDCELFEVKSISFSYHTTQKKYFSDGSLNESGE
jgi:hypothetical protein